SSAHPFTADSELQDRPNPASAGTILVCYFLVAQAFKRVLSSSSPTSKQDNAGLTALCHKSHSVFNPASAGGPADFCLLLLLGWAEGFEPSATRTTIRRSTKLSYARRKIFLTSLPDQNRLATVS